jgi:hypothetical protein
MSMRRRQHHGRDRTGRAPQFDLFAPLPAADHPETTVWRALPEETQRSLTGLLARLLSAHAANAPRGGRHEH